MGIKGIINGELKSFTKPRVKNNNGNIVKGNIKFKDENGNIRRAFSNKYPLTINCNVDNTEVSINNTIVGYILNGILNLDLEAGTYNFTFSKEEYITQERTITINNNKEITVNLIPSGTPKGNMIIETNVPADIYLDGDYIDRNTEVTINTTFGIHSLKIIEEGYITIDTSVNFTQNNQRFTYPLEPVPIFNLIINSNIGSTSLTLTDSKGKRYNAVTSNGLVELSLIEEFYTIKGEYTCPNTGNTVETLSSVNLKDNTTINITLPKCPDPIIPKPTTPNINITSITSNSAKISTSSANAINYVIKVNGTTRSNTTSLILTDLIPNTTYTVSVTATNTSGSTTATKTFTTNDVSAPSIYDKEATFMSDKNYGIALIRFKSTSESHNYFKIDVDLISKNDSNGASVYSTSNLDSGSGSGRTGWVKVRCHIPNYPSWVKFKVKVRSYYNGTKYSTIAEKSFKVQIINSNPDYVKITTL